MRHRRAIWCCSALVAWILVGACASSPTPPTSGAFEIALDAEQLRAAPLEEALVEVTLTPASSAPAQITWQRVAGPNVTTIATSGPALRFVAPADAGVEQVVSFVVRATRGDVVRERTVDVTVETFTLPAVVLLAEPEEGDEEILPLSDIEPAVDLLPWNVLPKGAALTIQMPSPTSAAPSFDEFFTMKLYRDSGDPSDVTSMFEYDPASASLRVASTSLTTFRGLLQGSRLSLVVSGFDTAGAAISFRVDFRYGFHTILGTILDEEGAGVSGIISVRGEFARLTRQVEASGGSFTVGDLPADTYSLLFLTSDGLVASESVLLRGLQETESVTMTAIDLLATTLPPADTSPEDFGFASLPASLTTRAGYGAAAPLATPPGLVETAASEFLGRVRAVSGAQGQKFETTGSVTIPRGTTRVLVYATVLTEEYPEYTTQQSDYNDTWSYAFQGGPIGAFARSGAVNNSHAASNVFVDRRTFDVGDAAASSDIRVGLSASATNIFDSALPTTTTIMVYAESATLKVTSLTHRSGAGFADGAWHFGATATATAKPLSLELRYEPKDAVVTGVTCEVNYADATFPITGVGALTSAAGKATFTLGFAAPSGMTPQPFLTMTISCKAQGTLQGGSPVTSAEKNVTFGDTTVVVPLFNITHHAPDVPRYGDRDRGGDGWARAHIIDHIAGSPWLSLLSVNDLSRENGGCFVKDTLYDNGRYNATATGITTPCSTQSGTADHATHQAGMSADVRYTPLGAQFPANGNPNRAAMLDALKKARAGDAAELAKVVAWTQSARATITQASADARIRQIYTGIEPWFVNLFEKGRYEDGTVIPDLGTYTLPARVSRAKDHDHHAHFDFVSR
jgi:hypothetical protein